jgi:hypothetical protein
MSIFIEFCKGPITSTWTVSPEQFAQSLENSPTIKQLKQEVSTLQKSDKQYLVLVPKTSDKTGYDIASQCGFAAAELAWESTMFNHFKFILPQHTTNKEVDDALKRVKKVPEVFQVLPYFQSKPQLTGTKLPSISRKSPSEMENRSKGIPESPPHVTKPNTSSKGKTKRKVFQV